MKTKGRQKAGPRDCIRRRLLICHPSMLSELRLVAWMVMCLAAVSTSAQAAGNVYAVLPTQGAGAPTEAGLVFQTMRLALQEQSLALIPAVTVETALGEHGVACAQSLVACGRLVGQSTGATHVLVSELWDQAGTYELRVALIDVRVETAPSFATVRTTASAELGPLAKRLALEPVAPDALSGTLSVQGPAKLDVVIDGVVVDRTPLLKRVRLAAGAHELELRGTDVAPWRQTLRIEAGQSVELVACVRNDAVTTAADACVDGSAPAADRSFPLRVVGVSAMAGGLVAGVIAGYFAQEATSASDRYALEPTSADVTTYQQARPVALGAGVVAGVLVLIGTGLLTAELTGLFAQESP
jgi:hypothetical protein